MINLIIVNTTYRSLRYSIAHQLRDDEQRVDYEEAGDSDVDDRSIVQLEMRLDREPLERV